MGSGMLSSMPAAAPVRPPTCSATHGIADVAGDTIAAGLAVGRAATTRAVLLVEIPLHGCQGGRRGQGSQVEAGAQGRSSFADKGQGS